MLLRAKYMLCASNGFDVKAPVNSSAEPNETQENALLHVPLISIV